MHSLKQQQQSGQMQFFKTENIWQNSENVKSKGQLPSDSCFNPAGANEISLLKRCRPNENIRKSYFLEKWQR